MDEIAIKVDNLSKTFRLPHEKETSIKGALINFKNHRTYEKQKVLKNISFEIKKGEFFGIVGSNGSGKSTLLKILAGIYAPSSGGVKINGSLVPFIELGVGFNPELTGRENVYLNGALLGFNRRQMDGMYREIVGFAELEKFMDQKLKNYSSGMQVRLAFSIAIRAKGDILLLDEVLAVGDATFQQKCFNYFSKLKAEGKTVLFISHSIDTVRQYCTSGILIDNGEIVQEGNIDKVTNKYLDLIAKKESEQITPDTKQPTQAGRRGTGKVRLSKVEVLNADGDKKQVFNDNDKEILVRVVFTAEQDVETPVYGITIKNAARNNVFSSNNLWQAIKSNNLKAGDKQEVVWRIPNVFNTGDYFITPAAADYLGRENFDSYDDMNSFKVRKKTTTSGIINADHTITITKPNEK